MARRRTSPAVWFLRIVAILIVLVIAGAFAYRIFEKQLMRWALVPSVPFAEAAMPAGANYRRQDMWIARPDLPAANPALWAPRGLAPTRTPGVSVFYVHPTSYLESDAWNARVDDPESQRRAALFVRRQASAFNGVGAIWAPRYRQATFGAFLAHDSNAARAFDLAYRDVRAAYEEFLRQAPRDRPILLAAHSQGSLHLMRLLAERVKGSPEAERIVAAYLIGWPISVSADLPALPLPACTAPDQARCLLSWQSFAEPADPGQVTEAFEADRGLAGRPRAGTAMLCTNPLTGMEGGAAPPSRNLGTLVAPEETGEPEFRPGVVGARCGERGILLLGPVESLPEMGPYALPGNNYHVYDYALFWANLRADAARRLAVFERGARR